MHIPRLSRPSLNEMRAITTATHWERGWYSDGEPYADDEAIRQAQRKGELVSVEPTDNLRPIMRLLTGKTGRHRLVTPLALQRVTELGELWRTRLDSQGLDSSHSLRLALTSVVRTDVQQAELVSDGALAVKNSVHTYGGAFDIDASAYYWVDPKNADIVSAVTTPDRPRVPIEGQTAAVSPLDIHAVEYDSRVTDALVDAATALKASGATSAILEYAGTYNQCLHLAANPQNTAALESVMMKARTS